MIINKNNGYRHGGEQHFTYGYFTSIELHVLIEFKSTSFKQNDIDLAAAVMTGCDEETIHNILFFSFRYE